MTPAITTKASLNTCAGANAAVTDPAATPITAGTARRVERDTRQGKSPAWEIDADTTLYRIPNPEVADLVNTIQKMAQKRAVVAATLIATSASEFFTQDVEDIPADRDTFGITDPAGRPHRKHAP